MLWSDDDDDERFFSLFFTTVYTKSLINARLLFNKFYLLIEIFKMR